MVNLSIPESALSSFGVVVMASASNIANVNTDGFKNQHVVLATGPLGEGVRVGAVYRDMSFTPHVINHPDENDVRDAKGRVKGPSYDALTGPVVDKTVELPREFANLIVMENAYSTNAVTIRAWDEMVGSILNVRI